MSEEDFLRLVIRKNGLAYYFYSAGPRIIDGGRVAFSPRGSLRSTSSWIIPEYAKSRIADTRGRGSGRCPKIFVRMEGMEACRSDTHKQFVEKQNGQRYQETIGERGGLHHVGSTDRSGDCCDRMLAIRQLLVTRSGRTRGDRSLTIAQTSLKSYTNTHQYCEHIVEFDHFQTVEPRQRLASCGFLQWRLHESLTSHPVRTVE